MLSNCLMLLAQTGSGPGANPAATAGVFAGFLTFLLIAMAIGVAVAIAICLLLYFPQKSVPPEYRAIEPPMVFLLIIPLFSLVWNFFVFQRVPESFRRAFAAHGRTDVGDCGRGIGLAYAITSCCTLIPCVGSIAALAALVLFIIFIVKIWGLKSDLMLVLANAGPVGSTPPPASFEPPNDAP